MKMHFDCWALVELEVNRDDDGVKYLEDASLVGGLFPTRQSMAPFVRSVALCDLKEEERYAQQWMVPRRPRTRIYEAVPLKGAQFSCLEELEGSICKAAMLRKRGIGKWETAQDAESQNASSLT